VRREARDCTSGPDAWRRAAPDGCERLVYFDAGAAPAKLVAGTPFTWTIRVYYEDTDTGGIVYYANYLKFFERARTEWLRSAGFGQRALLQEHGLQFVVAGIECEFRQPARLDDLIDIDVRIARAGRASFEFVQTARRGADVLANARVRVGCIDTQRHAPAAMPAAMVQALGTLPRED
jgi:acyl-CoA thioester hydrolase